MNIGIDFEKLNQGVRPQVMTHFTKVPNSVIDEIMGQISDKAFKCLSLIIRQTIGYDRASHTIAITQFQKHCNIKKRDTVMAAIKELEQCKLIKVERQTGVLNNYFITLNQYQQTGLVPNSGSTTKRDGTSTTKRDGTSTVERDTNKETLKENFKENIYTQVEEKFSSEIQEIFEFWRSTFSKPKTLLSDKRKSKIKARLKQGYSVDDLKLAIVNCSKSEFHVKGGHIDLELICRDETKVDSFMQRATVPGNTQNQIKGPMADFYADFYAPVQQPQMRDIEGSVVE